MNTPHAKINERIKRIVEHRWNNCDKILRGQFKACQIQRIHKKRLDNMQCPVFLPTAYQAQVLHKIKLHYFY